MHEYVPLFANRVPRVSANSWSFSSSDLSLRFV